MGVLSPLLRRRLSVGPWVCITPSYDRAWWSFDVALAASFRNTVGHLHQRYPSQRRVVKPNTTSIDIIQ
jgi:hypothetical protein